MYRLTVAKLLICSLYNFRDCFNKVDSKSHTIAAFNLKNSFEVFKINLEFNRVG
jgi:hypothetical protein